MTDKRTKIEFLDTLFATRRAYSWEEISNRFETQFQKGFSKRSFFYYLKTLKENGAPIEFRTEKTEFETTTYYYYDEKFNLSNSTLNKYDTSKLKSALTTLQQFEHLPQMQDLKEVILKLEQQIDTPVSENATLLFEHKPHSTGVHWLRALHNHIVKQEVIQLTYQPFPHDEKDLTRWESTGLDIHFHPYFLKESKNLWYIFGYNATKKQIENYALDRIQSIEVAPNLFYKPNDSIDAPSFFNDIVGVTRFTEQPLEIFTIRVNPIIAPYWLNRPLHASQKLVEHTPHRVIERGQYFTFSFELRWNYEWQSLILSYGANVEVIEPLWFRESMKNIHVQALSLYND
jgi:predicted DNA-binding transcriptional regulator YafY